MSELYSLYLEILEPHPEYLICFEMSPDGWFLASSCYDIIKLWDLKDGSLICSHEHHKRTLGFNLVINSDWTQFVTDYDYWIEVRDLLTGDINSQFHMNGSHAMAINPDGKVVVLAEREPHISDGSNKLFPLAIWNLQTETLLGKLPGHEYMASLLIFSQDGSKLMSHSYRYSTKIWALGTRQELHTFSLVPSKYWIDSFIINSNGETIATGRKLKNDGSADFEMWNLLENKTVHSFSNAYNNLNVVPPYEPRSKVASNGEIIVSANGRNIDVWNGIRGEIIWTIQGQESTPQRIAISQDGSKIASYGGDGIRVWQRINY